ncbi:MAG: hypothetical protein K2I91_06790 [Muribaculaceae bacterium]|nr:hypothetical protein [Muribaculaceae bacterium]
MIFKSMLCAGMMMAGGLYASAFNLISPEQGVVNEVSSLSSVQLVWDNEVMEFPDGVVTLLDSNGDTVATGSNDFDMENWSAYVITFADAPTVSGMYTMVVPANMAADNSNPEYRIQYKLDYVAESALPTMVEPASGSDIVQGDGVEFNAVRLTFGNATALTVNRDNISLTDQDGNPVEFDIMGWYAANDPMLPFAEDGPFVRIVFNENGNMPSGTYTLVCNPYTFATASGVDCTEKLEYTYTYTKTKADVDETPLEILSALLGHVKSNTKGDSSKYTFEWVGTDAETITPDMPLAEFVGFNNVGDENLSSGILVTFNHGEKAGYVTAELLDMTTTELLRSTECLKQADNSFLLTWPSTIRLYEGHDYELMFRTYDNVTNKVQFGDGAALTFKGTTEGFKYSSAKFVTVVPTSGETINRIQDNKVTVLFSEPVRIEAVANLGMGTSMPVEVESSNYEEYDYVWYAYIPDYIMTSYPEVNIGVVAYGEDGYIVADGENAEEHSINQFSYYLTFCQPRIYVRETNSNVAELNTFRVFASSNQPINTSWGAFPYVTDNKGNIVANVNMEYYTNEWGDKEPFKPTVMTEGGEFDSKPMELEFQITPAITEKGRYQLVFPTAAFNFGEQFDGVSSVEQTYDYSVVDFYPVTYTVDNCSVALSPVELGSTSKLSIDINEGWVLDTLTLNGDDITKEVANGRYESAPVTGAMNYVATIVYDGLVLTPTGMDDVVSDLNLRGWSEGGKLYVAGLMLGQTVNVYSVGGSLMGTADVEDDNETLEFAVAEGTYIITVSDGTQRVALKLINK